MSILLVVGTRPEAIKLGPVAAELATLGADWRCVLTGQHTTLLAGTPAETDLAGSATLALASDGNVARWMTVAQARLTAYIKQVAPSIVVVQGDTMSAHVGAVTANLLGVPVAHVEAGVRSHNLNDPWPEETTRVGIAQIADWHYAPTSTAFGNLVAEGVSPAKIRVPGNTAVSALARYAGDVKASPIPDDMLVITLHRREVQTEAKANLLYGCVRHQALMHRNVRFAWPVHPAMQRVVKRLAEPPNLVMCAPLAYEPFVRLVAGAKGVITDSGGLVEETATLGVPTVILRASNDRPEAVEAGIAIQREPTSIGVREGVEVLLAGSLPRRPTCVFGYEDSARQVAKHLASMAPSA